MQAGHTAQTQIAAGSSTAIPRPGYGTREKRQYGFWKPPMRSQLYFLVHRERVLRIEFTCEITFNS
jgi:hypothetical protein